MNRLIVTFLLMILGSSLVAQDTYNSLSFLQDEDDFEFEERRGWIFGLNFGAYFANKKSANFYNGTCTWGFEDGQARCNSIEERLYLGTTEQQVQNDLNIQSFTIPADASPLNMRYNPGILVGFRFGYRFNNENAIIADLNYADLKAADKFTLVTNLVPDNGQGTQDIRIFNIIGEEQRFNFSLGYRTGLVINETANWFFGLGGQFTAFRLNANYLEIEGSTYDLWVGFVGPNNFNGPVGNLTYNSLNWYGETGVEAFFNDRYEASLGLRFSRDNVILGDFNQKLMNYHLFFSVSI